MGCSISTRTSSSSACRIVKVVQLNGSVEQFDYPVSVSELTAKLPKHFVYLQSQLLSPCSKPLLPTTYLEPGKIYFLLPYSFFQSDFSPADLVTIARKLSNRAKRDKPKVESVNNSNNNNAASADASPVWRSPGRAMKTSSTSAENEHDVMMMHTCSKSPSWKPILATIRERSFNRRSESDLQEKGLEIMDKIHHSSRFVPVN
ncbi:OLC1v1035940C1 [Oldenlandia corymbosa var. corymbosa]|uniref:OLC1v1035940C1 n=1 Tax=Oldenlandia corymbosa var. corymbosa TaxID=529605 RepID=A0AAV1CWN8_OLDCO|nr:OLC1v1035940C1 [Oldenlandia corymbosa var. corymbosa]